MEKVIGKVIRAQTAIKHGVNLQWFEDFGYKPKPNKYGWLDFEVIKDDEGAGEMVGQIQEGAAFILKVKCPECGQVNYEAFFSETSEDMVITCSHCKSTFEVGELKSISRYR